MTGGIGSGKSEAKKAFRELSVPTIDLDDIAHQITQKNCSGYVEITKNFGNIYLDGNEEIDRKSLKIDIFNSPELKNKIESILHPIIFEECKKQIHKYKAEEYIVIIIALLFETENYLNFIDESILIDCDETLQFNRVSSRDKIDKKLIKSIIKSQLHRSQKIIKADTIINNNLSKASLKKEIYQYHQDLKLRINRK
jgi:dephospho-CoA kinase|tara:strand:+ start:1002 stop:1592 length:591 start_codon:yes stop_codon:yes gene_type:complete